MDDSKRMKVSYLRRNGRYLVVKEDGTSEILNSKEEFDRYIKENNYEVIN